MNRYANASASISCQNAFKSNQLIGCGAARSFAVKKDDNDADADASAPKKRGRPKKAVTVPDIEASQDASSIVKKVVKRTRRTKAQIAEEEANANKPVQKKMYVLKFNSPILPYAKFPLTHNKYIQDFLKMYELDKDKVDHVIGVHFPQNNN
jgi:hypothetical protein